MAASAQVMTGTRLQASSLRLELGYKSEAGDEQDAEEVEDKEPRPSRDQLDFCEFCFLVGHYQFSLITELRLRGYSD